MEMKNFYRAKKWLMPVMGVIMLMAFLVICSEPEPGVEWSVWRFALPKVAALAAFGVCVWAVNKLDSQVEESNKG